MQGSFQESYLSYKKGEIDQKDSNYFTIKIRERARKISEKDDSSKNEAKHNNTESLIEFSPEK